MTFEIAIIAIIRELTKNQNLLLLNNFLLITSVVLILILLVYKKYRGINLKKALTSKNLYLYWMATVTLIGFFLLFKNNLFFEPNSVLINNQNINSSNDSLK